MAKNDLDCCEFPVENFGDRTVAIWLHIFHATWKEISRKLVELVENLYKSKIQQANSLSTDYTGSTDDVYSDNSYGVCSEWCVSWPLLDVASL